MSALVRKRLVEGWLLRKQIERVYLLLGGHIFFQTLSAAVQLDLFTLLSQHPRLTRAQIAARLHIADQPARILLLGCTSLGLLRKDNDHYSNSPLTRRFFTKNVPGNLVSLVEWQHHINYKAMYAFCDAIKANRNVGLDEFDGNEPTLYERLAHHPPQEKIFQDAMEAISIQANELLAKFLDLSHVKHLVDVGGGNGTNIIALARKYPTLKATVFDSLSVCRIARENIEAAGLTDRLGAVAGDCFQDEFPKGVDCILFAHFFTIWSEKKIGCSCANATMLFSLEGPLSFLI